MGTTGRDLQLVNLMEKRVSPEEVKLKMLLFCMEAHLHKFKWKGEYRFIIKSGKSKYEFSASEIQPVINLFSYLFREEKEKIFINPLLTKNPFTTSQCGCVIVYGPQEGLQNITYEQFVGLQTYFNQMQQNPETINDFLSVIYKDSAGNSSPGLMSKMSKTAKTAILWYYIGSLRFIAERFPNVFSSTESSGSSLFENQMRVIDALAANDVTKKEAVKKSFLYDALYTMEIAAENAEKLKR